jgi:hypothetical protein
MRDIVGHVVMDKNSYFAATRARVSFWSWREREGERERERERKSKKDMTQKIEQTYQFVPSLL